LRPGHSLNSNRQPSGLAANLFSSEMVETRLKICAAANPAEVSWPKDHNDLACQTLPKVGIGAKGVFGALSNRAAVHQQPP
jgi:hypothetical protein